MNIIGRCRKSDGDGDVIRDIELLREWVTTTFDNDQQSIRPEKAK